MGSFLGSPWALLPVYKSCLAIVSGPDVARSTRPDLRACALWPRRILTVPKEGRPMQRWWHTIHTVLSAPHSLGRGGEVLPEDGREAMVGS